MKPVRRYSCIWVRLLQADLELAETDGTETIATAKVLFPSCLDSDFASVSNEKINPTPKKLVCVDEIVHSGCLREIFSDDLNDLCLTQPQIVQFVRIHRVWLRKDDESTFFLYKSGKEFQVAQVRVRDDGLGIFSRKLSDDHVFLSSELNRVVTPQL